MIEVEGGRTRNVAGIGALTTRGRKTGILSVKERRIERARKMETEGERERDRRRRRSRRRE